MAARRLVPFMEINGCGSCVYAPASPLPKSQNSLEKMGAIALASLNPEPSTFGIAPAHVAEMSTFKGYLAGTVGTACGPNWPHFPW